jgi:NSS family neurotransmitter:Na+ symporter
MQQPNFVGWKSRWTFILAATGSAVGLGNIWKFPYITGEYGGGAFVLVYLACILLVGMPVMIAEISIGRFGRTDPIHSTVRGAQDAKTTTSWSFIGFMGVLAGLMILMFYSVVAGWALDYVWQSASGAYAGLPPDAIEGNFTALVNDSSRQLIWHSIFIVLTGSVVAVGVTRGIGTVVDVLMPILFILLLVLLGYSWTNGDFKAGLDFMFRFDFSKLTPEAILTALGHAFFTLSLGMGAIMAYGAYMPENSSVAKTTLIIALLDTVIALIAGMAIFPLVFANGLEPGQGPGLMFATLPVAFSSMPGGVIFSTIFFLLVTIAALSSSISLIEPGVAWLERQGVRRAWSTLIFSLISWAGGIACIYVPGVFDGLDYATTNIMLPLGGLLIAIFVGWIMRRNTVRKQLRDTGELMFNIWYVVTRFIAPAGVIAILLYQLGVLQKLGWI